MEFDNISEIGSIVVFALAALALVIFLATRNWKDRKDILPPDTTDDPVQKGKMDRQRKQDRV